MAKRQWVGLVGMALSRYLAVRPCVEGAGAKEVPPLPSLRPAPPPVPGRPGRVSLSRAVRVRAAAADIRSGAASRRHRTRNGERGMESRRLRVPHGPPFAWA